MQSQHPASAYLALWNRTSDFDPDDLDRAYAEHLLIKATLMRITLHTVHVDDHAVLHAALQQTLRAARVGDTRFTAGGLSVAEVEAKVPELKDFMGQRRTTAEVQDWIRTHTGSPGQPIWWALRSFGPFWHAPTGGPWSFGLRPEYVAARSLPFAGDPDDALALLVKRYLAAFGPATLADVAQFGMLYRSRLRSVWSRLLPELEQLEGPNGSVLWDVPDGPRPDAATPAPSRLMAMWDSTLLAYADRRRIIPEEYRRILTRVNGDVLPSLLVDGYVAGVWRTTADGVEATAFRPLSRQHWGELELEAAALRTMLSGRETLPYQRFGHWWSRFSGAEVRLFND